MSTITKIVVLSSAVFLASSVTMISNVHSQGATPPPTTAPAPSAPPAAAAPAPTGSCKDPAKIAIKEGMRVVAQWSGDNWWVAKVDKISGENVDVTYSDNQKGLKKIAQMVPYPEALYTSGLPPCIKAGDKVVSKWRHDSWWLGTIDKVDATIENCDITYTDGEKGLQKCKDMVKFP